MIVTGTQVALHVMRFDPQIASRFEQIELPIWTETDELRRFVAGFLAMRPVKKILMHSINPSFNIYWH